MSNEELFNIYFNTHTINSISDYATKNLGLCKDEKYLSERYWSEEEDQFLIENYASMDTNEFADIFNKTTATVIARAIKFGISKDRWWTDEEILILKKYYPYMRNKELYEKYFSYRTYDSVTNKALKLGLIKDPKYLYKTECETLEQNSEKLYRHIKGKDGEIHKEYKLKGKDNPKYKPRIKLNCAYCGKEIYRLESDIASNNNTFCSVSCSARWKSENMSGVNSPIRGKVSEKWTNEMRKQQAINVIDRLLKSDFSYRKTKPQLIIDNLLNQLNIKYKNEYNCKYYLIDNYLIDYNLMIEVQGNFFYCNPVMNLDNNRKAKILGKDKAKHTYIKKYYNIEILYLWEKDIYENIEICKQLILKYINNNGILENYHSYNYCSRNNKLVIIKDKYNIGY